MDRPTRHVMFSPSAAGTLKQALVLAKRPDEVLCLLDDYSFGPIASETKTDRVQWVDEMLGYPDWQDIADQSETFLAGFDSVRAPVTVWTSRRAARIYCGFLWWLSQVGKLPVSIIEVEDLSLADARGMVDRLDHAIPLQAENRSRYLKTWHRLKAENAPLRVIDGDDLISAQIEHFDDSLLRHATPEWRKMARIVGGTLGDHYVTGVCQTSDLFLTARLASLANAGRLEWRGDIFHMPHCELRLPKG